MGQVVVPLSAHSFLHVERPGTGIWVVPAQPWDCRQIALPPWGSCVSPFLSPSSLDSQKSFPLLESLPCSCLLRAAPRPLPHGAALGGGNGLGGGPGLPWSGGAHRGSELAGTDRRGWNKCPNHTPLPGPERGGPRTSGSPPRLPLNRPPALPDRGQPWSPVPPCGGAGNRLPQPRLQPPLASGKEGPGRRGRGQY